MVDLVLFILMHLDLSGSAGGTLESGRSVMAYSDAWSVSCEFSRDTATVETGGHEVVVAAAEVTVDGKVRIPIAEATDSVVVTLKRGRITLIADGVTIAECRR